MGYFVCAQYDVKEKHVILNEVKNPTEELTGYILFALVVGYFVCAQYDVLFLLLQNSTIRRRSRILA